ncbi:hypothetical protein D3C73_1123890 [compost metagenome]
MRGAAQQQAAEQPGHQCITGQHYPDAQHVVGQCRRLVLGHRHDADQCQHHCAQPAHPAAQKLDLRLVPAEVNFRHPAGSEDAVGGVEHQPGLGQLPERGAKVGVLPAGVDLQGIAAQGKAQAHWHRQEDVDQDRLGRMPLAVTAKMTDVLVHLAQPLVQVFAAPQQGADHQQ